MTSDTTQGALNAAQTSTSSNDLWDQLKIGSKVLAESKSEPGWWDAEVIGVHDRGSMITLKWTGYDDTPNFMVSRYSVALKRPPAVK